MSHNENMFHCIFITLFSTLVIPFITNDTANEIAIVITIKNMNIGKGYLAIYTNDETIKNICVSHILVECLPKNIKVFVTHFGFLHNAKTVIIIKPVKGAKKTLGIKKVLAKNSINIIEQPIIPFAAEGTLFSKEVIFVKNIILAVTAPTTYSNSVVPNGPK